VIRTFIKYWVPVLLWLAVIFSASADKSSGQRSSRIIAPIVRFLVPNISQKNLDTIVHSVRKTAHMTEYAVLALLLFRALAKVGRGVPAEPSAVPVGRSVEVGRSVLAEPPPSFPLRAGAIAFALSALYAMTDEFHQTFVPSREGQITDVIIDSFGAAAGLCALWLVGRWRKRW